MYFERTSMNFVGKHCSWLWQIMCRMLYVIYCDPENLYCQTKNVRNNNIRLRVCSLHYAWAWELHGEYICTLRELLRRGGFFLCNMQWGGHESRGRREYYVPTCGFCCEEHLLNIDSMFVWFFLLRIVDNIWIRIHKNICILCFIR